MPGETCLVSTGRGTRRVHLVRGEGGEGVMPIKSSTRPSENAERYRCRFGPDAWEAMTRHDGRLGGNDTPCRSSQA